jgi:hypothetical protein
VTALTDATADMIEPDAKAMIGDGASDDLVALVSIAISLRRVADRIDDTIDHYGGPSAIRTRSA